MSDTEKVAALVWAIRRAHPGPRYGAGVVSFTVRDVFEFAARLVEQGVTVSDDKREAA